MNYASVFLSEILVNFYETTQSHIQENIIFLLSQPWETQPHKRISDGNTTTFVSTSSYCCKHFGIPKMCIAT